MHICKSSSELLNIRNSIPGLKKTGFVPTMGALHAGHLSLVEIAGKQTDVVIASIFVNPTQFNDPEDLRKYPRTLDADLEMLSKTCVDIVFIPEVADIYPVPDHRQFDFGHIGSILEGSHRPGHFNGVAQVVSKLFDLVRPDKAFFGHKDFQQLAIIKKMVAQLNYNVGIVACPIVREPDGLAMSSRNKLLTHEQRAQAPLISKTLFEATEKQQTMTIPELKNWVISTLNANPLFQVEYFDIVSEAELLTVTSWDEPVTKIGCIAIKLGKIRLIDNIFFA